MFALESVAQTAKSAYFLDGTFHNFKLNPAMDAERNFASFGLGNLSLSTYGNVGVSHFLYPQGNHLTTFMSGSVSQQEFLDRLPEYARLGMNFDETFLAFGFRLLGGYTSFSVSMHSSTSMALPKGFFEFAKKGLQENCYNFSGINMNTTNYAAVTLGYSREVYKNLRVGANLKYLIGLVYADMTIDKFNVELSDKRWFIEGHAQAQVALFGETYFDDDDTTLGNLRMSSYTPTARGFAIDLGAVYDMKEFVPGLTLSASVLDLGTIKWQNMMSIQDNGSPIQWEGITDATIDNLSSAFENRLDDMGENAENLMDSDKFNVHDIKTAKTSLQATMYLGAEYNMPFYQPLSVAMLYGKKFSQLAHGGWNEFRGYVNVAPLKWFEASFNGGFTTYGASWGWMLNFHPAGFNFFVGSDYMLTKITPQFIPVNNLNYHINFGANITFGKRK